MNKNIARLAVTAGLTAALSFGGVMAPVTMAFAAEGTPTVATDGNVKIDEKTYKDTTFKGIQIFTAKVTQNYDGSAWSGDKTLSDIDWASPDVMSVVTSAFADVVGAPAANAGAQAWAKYIKENAGDKVGQTAKVDAGSTLDKIAAALEGSTLTWTTPGDSSKGDFKALNTGYWLFVTANVGSTTSSDLANGNTDAYTSPIFTVVGGEDVKAEPKKDVPNVTKAVKDDKDGKFVTDDSKNVFIAANKAADSAAEQLVEYQLAGTVASNINTYVKYSYTFTDNLPSTMVPNLNGNNPVVEVKINDSVVDPTCYSAAYVPGKSTNMLTVSFENLREAKDTAGNPITVDGSSTVYVNYKAKLDANKITQDMLGKAQVNNVKLTYSNNPHTNGTGTTVDHPAYDYTYGIDVTKVGSDEDKTGKPKTLEGVQFTLQEKDFSEFIKADGTTTSNKDDAILTTDSNGKINVVGLDEGTYVLTEVKPAPGYNNSAANGVTFTISRTLNQDGADVTPDTTSAIVAGQDVVQQNSAKAEVGKLSFTIVDQKGSGLPLTGLNGVTFTWIAGGAVLCIGVAHLIRSRKQAEESEQE
ncbi:SpaA isopeptide-forming pilin-related protein [Collinsella sp. AM34-10]|uniref:SpaA isopeptide-forming pilin-related protein n=1 Tax=Collinsella sp. AM34-10 TaxID=2292316 RepID=UPI0013141A38|nr:SpaA isopeptide-forming pilin-related protein [Collinsella sp. AM34-10]